MTCAVERSTLRVLVGDDNPAVREAVRLVLKPAGHRIDEASSPVDILNALAGDAYDLLLLDLNYTRDTTSGREGLDLLDRVRAGDPAMPVVVMTAWGSIELAVEAMRRGAVDFVTKPWDNAALLAVVEKQAASGRRETSELDIAARVQRNLFPRQCGSAGALDCAGAHAAARQVGGDYYDYFEPGAFVLADVSGKGVPAALLMANLQALFRVQAGQPAATLLPSVNRQFHAATAPEHYATAFYALYDEESRTLGYVNCGHPAALLVRESGEIELLRSTSTVLGMFEDWQCAESTVPMSGRDVVVVYSDGVTEAANARGDEFGEERVVTVARACRHRSVTEIAGTLVDAVRAFSGHALMDDVTVVAARVTDRRSRGL